MKSVLILFSAFFSFSASATMPQACLDLQVKATADSLFKSSKFIGTNEAFNNSAKWLIGFGAEADKVALFTGAEDLVRLTYKSSRGQVTFNVFEGSKLISYSGEKDGESFEKLACSGFETREFLDELYRGVDLNKIGGLESDRIGVYGVQFRIEELPLEARKSLNRWLKQKDLNILGQDYIYSIRDIRHNPENYGVVGFEIKIATKWFFVQDEDEGGYYEYWSGNGFKLAIDTAGKIQGEVVGKNMHMEFAD